MADEKSGFEKWLSSSKGLVSTLRDGVFFVLFLLLLLFPGTVKDRLKAAGFTKGKLAGFEWESEIKQSTDQTKTVGQVVHNADENFKALIDRLAEIEKSVTDPSLKRKIASLGTDAKTSQSQLLKADQAAKRSLYAQQSIVEAVSPSSVSDQGYLFLGKVNEKKDQWLPGSPVAIAVVPPSIGKGTKLRIRDDTYWWADSATGQHVDAPILSVARAGTIVSVDKVDFPHAKGGGYYVWIKAHSES